MKKTLIISLLLSSFSYAYGFSQDSTINELNKLFRDYLPFSVFLSDDGATKSTNNISVSFEKPYVVVSYNAYPLKYVLKIDFLNATIQQEYNSVLITLHTGIEATILNEKGSRQALPSHWKLYGGTSPLNTRIFNGFILLQKQIIQSGLGSVTPHPFDDISLKDKGTTPTSLNKHSNVHIVKKGESLRSIAQLYDDISFYDLMQINGFKKNTKISVGDTLVLKERTTKISKKQPQNQTIIDPRTGKKITPIQGIRLDENGNPAWSEQYRTTGIRTQEDADMARFMLAKQFEGTNADRTLRNLPEPVENIGDFNLGQSRFDKNVDSDWDINNLGEVRAAYQESEKKENIKIFVFLGGWVLLLLIVAGLLTKKYSKSPPNTSKKSETLAKKLLEVAGNAIGILKQSYPMDISRKGFCEILLFNTNLILNIARKKNHANWQNVEDRYLELLYHLVKIELPNKTINEVEGFVNERLSFYTCEYVKISTDKNYSPMFLYSNFYLTPLSEEEPIGSSDMLQILRFHTGLITMTDWIYKQLKNKD